QLAASRGRKLAQHPDMKSLDWTSRTSPRNARRAPRLVELLRCRLPLGALDERNLGAGMTVLQRGEDADHTESLGRLHGLGGGSRKGPLGLRHRGALVLRSRHVLGLRYRLRFGDLARLVIDDHLRELVTFL